MNMETTAVILFYEKCRLCLANPGEKNIFQIEDLQGDIFACTGVKVSSSDNLPEKICTKCLEVVTNAKELRELSIKNDIHLKTLFINEHDDDSRETVCLDEEEADNLPQSPGPDILVKTGEKRKSNETAKDDPPTANSKTSESNTGGPPKKNKLKIRKDLFHTTRMNNKVKVRSKEDYNNYKEKVKRDPNVMVEFECETCDKLFDTYKKLYLHTRMHNKKIYCPLDGCGKNFATKGDLEKHLRIHTGIRPYSCEICDKTFTQQGTLKQHRENVHYIFTVH